MKLSSMQSSSQQCSGRVHGRALLVGLATVAVCTAPAAAAGDVQVQPTSLSINCTGAPLESPLSAPDAPPPGTLDLSDPNAALGEVHPGEITIRFKGARAAALHAHRLTVAPHDRGRWTENPAPAGLARLPASIVGLRPQVSGHARAMRTVNARAELRAEAAMMAGGKALGADRVPAVSRALAGAFQAADPMGIFRAKVAPGTDLRALCLELMKHPDVVYASPSPLCRPVAVPNDPLYPRMWNLPLVNMPGAWDISGNTPGAVRVCVVDSGVRMTHADLAGRIADPADVYPDNGDAFADSDPNNDDPDGHGTACAGIIGAIRGNNLLVAGIAPVTIVPVNCYYTDGTNVYLANYTDGIFWGVDHGADVISLSLGGTNSAPYPEEVDAINYAQAHGVVVCAAAGNDDGPAERTYPGALPYCIQVGAVDQNSIRVRPETWWWGSNYGPTLDICAPGQGNVGLWDSILSLHSGSDTAYISYFNGTSAATPHVAGLAALLKHINPSLSAQQIRNCIESTARDQVGLSSEDTPGWDPYHGYGLINGLAAAQCAREGGNCITISNTGSEALQITAIDAPAWAHVSPLPPFSIPAGGRQPISVTACGQCAGSALDGTLIVRSNDPDDPAMNITLHVDCASCQPLFNCQATPEAVLLGESAILTAVTGGSDAVEWFEGGCGGTPLPGGATPTVSPTEPTTYYARSINAGAGCVSSECCSVTVGVISGDLSVQTLYGPTTGGAGQTVSFSVVTRNGTGSTPAGASVTRVYWSADATLDAGDREVASCAVPALVTGQSSSCSAQVAIDAGTAAGTYYVIARADADGTVNETNETNNVRAQSIKVGPDLSVFSFSCPFTSGAGQTLTVSAVAKNGATASPAEASTVRFYWSADVTLDAQDEEIGSCATPALGAGASAPVCTVLKAIPADAAPGSSYVFVKLDADEAVVETNEANNTTYRSLTIGPDLAVSSLSVPGTSGLGQVVTVSATVKNGTTASATGAFVTRLYWSSDNAIDAADRELANCSVAGLGADQSATCQTTLAISEDLAPVAGTYYVIASADADNTVVSELSEINNLKVAAVKIGPDLSVSSFTCPSSSGVGQTITVSAVTRNAATATPAGASTMRFYWSTDIALDAADEEIGSCTVAPLGANGSSLACAVQKTISGATAPGTYYILVRADADDAVAEINEGNNGGYRALRIGSDLTVSSLTAPSVSGVGQVIAVSATVKNGSTSSPTGPFLTRLYWSTNNVLDGADLEIGSCEVSGLDPGQSVQCQTTLTMTEAIAPTPGTYYAIAMADTGDAVVSELSESNNVRMAAVKVGPDLTVAALTGPAISGAGQTVNLTATVSNGATCSPTGAFFTRLYWSTDSALDASDREIASCSVAGLAPGGSATCQVALNLPLDTASATYYVLAKADADEGVNETNELNNSRSLMIKVGPDLTVSGMTGPLSAKTGDTMTFTATVKNGAASSPAGAFVTRLYLSTNAAIDAGDVEIGSCVVSGLAPNQTSPCSFVVTAPPATVRTKYYVLAKADADDVLVETSESNNTNLRSLTINP